MTSDPPGTCRPGRNARVPGVAGREVGERGVGDANAGHQGEVSPGPEVGQLRQVRMQGQGGSARIASEPGSQQIAAKVEEVGLISRVPHASDVLTGKYIEPPTFEEGDHRSHRRAQWMADALRKADQVKFLALDDARTMSQSAIKFCLAQPTIVSVLPNFTNLDELREYASAPETPDLTEEEQSRLDDLWENAFDLEEPVREFREV